MSNARMAASSQCPVFLAARRWGGGTAIDGRDGPTTFGALDARVGLAARALTDAGLQAGEPVALQGPNGPDLVVAIFAVVRAGGVAVPLSTRLPAEAAKGAIRHVGARRVLVADPSVFEDSTVRSEGLQVLTMSALGDSATLSAPVEGRELDVDRPAIAVFTSGSSGPPKAAALTLSNLHYSALGSNRNIPLGRTDRWLLSLPLYHVGGLGILFRCLLAGAAAVLPDVSDFGSDDFLERMRITHISLVPTQMRRMIRASVPVHRLKAILVGGGPVPLDLWASTEGTGANLFVSYGLTEMASQVATTAAGGPRRGSADYGSVLPFRSAKMDRGCRIMLRGETLFAGYIEAGQLHRPFDSDGWFRTGDLGRFAPDGHLLVEGRADNMFVSGGENIQPEEIERALLSFPEVERAVVVDVPDWEFGARPVAFVDFAGPALSASEISDLLEVLVPRFMHPVRILPFPDGPPGTLEKLDRTLLRRVAEGAGESGS